MSNSSIFIASVFAVLVGGCGEITEAESEGNPNAPDVVSLSTDRVPLAGGAVTLTGTGFIEGTSVFLGTTRVPDVSIASEEELTFQAPAGEVAEVALPLAIYNDSGSTVLEEAITYNELPTLVVSSPPVASVGAGGTLTIRGTGFVVNNAGPVTVHIGDYELANVQVVDDETITATIPAGGMADVAIARDVVVTTPNGVVTLPERFTFVSGGLFFSRSRIDDNGGATGYDPDKGQGLYYVDPDTGRIAYVLPLKTGLSKLTRTPGGGLGTRFSNRGSEGFNSSVMGTINVLEGVAEAQGVLKLDGDPFLSVRVRALALAQGSLFGIGQYQQENPCCSSFNEFGRIDTSTMRFTPFGSANGLDRETCLVEGPGGTLLAIRRFDGTIRSIETAAGTITDGPALTGDIGDSFNGNAPTCHGADLLNGTVYAIQFSRDNALKATLVTISPAGAVTKIVDLPSGATGLVANPIP